MHISCGITAFRMTMTKSQMETFNIVGNLKYALWVESEGTDEYVIGLVTWHNRPQGIPDRVNGGVTFMWDSESQYFTAQRTRLRQSYDKGELRSFGSTPVKDFDVVNGNQLLLRFVGMRPERTHKANRVKTTSNDIVTGTAPCIDVDAGPELSPELKSLLSEWSKPEGHATVPEVTAEVTGKLDVLAIKAILGTLNKWCVENKAKPFISETGKVGIQVVTVL